MSKEFPLGSARYQGHCIMCYALDEDVMKEAKRYANNNYVSLSKLAFFALKEKLEHEGKI
jgi:hypothetical protein